MIPGAAAAQTREKEALSLLNIPAKNAAGLLEHFKNRTSIVLPDFDADKPISESEQKWADEALSHRFFVHPGYQPSYFYGNDINWELWPVKDNEMRWQIHRMKWWVPLGRAYRNSGNEIYAAEWTAEYVDWINKNPLKGYGKAPSSMEDADNVYFAWRPLEVSDRVRHQIEQFLLFLPSEHFTPEFLCEFLVNYHRHCTHLAANFSQKGNHLLFEAQRLLYAAVFFPEYKDAQSWKTAAIDILNREIGKQVYPDGIQYELDPHYHLESAGIFFDALRICEANGIGNAFPDTYRDTVLRMLQAIYNYSYPDRTNPMFADFHGQPDILPLYRKWAEVFKEDPMLEYLATEGKSGKTPEYFSKAFPDAGYYCMRNGWGPDATVMVMKAGPEGFWHNQPDNGTFEYWRKGRNFFPDSGGYVYGGDEEVLKMRRWFRSTSAHNTISLNGKDIENPNSELISWTSNSVNTAVTVETASYENFRHRRTVLFSADGTVIIRDLISGEAEGVVDLSYNLAECEPKEDFLHRRISTAFPDGNNVSLSVMSDAVLTVRREEGRVSYRYRQYSPRPKYVFSAFKSSGKDVQFVTVISPED